MALLLVLAVPYIQKMTFLWSHSYSRKEVPELDGFATIDVEDPVLAAARAREMEQNKKLLEKIEMEETRKMLIEKEMKEIKERREREEKARVEKERKDKEDKERAEREARERSEEERLRKFFVKFMAEKENSTIGDVDKMFDEWKKGKEKI